MMTKTDMEKSFEPHLRIILIYLNQIEISLYCKTGILIRDWFEPATIVSINVDSRKNTI
jgi:hypothetical protein